jgi:DMSO/TMAO reductase YedYZ heme-binding membrane subunit
MFSLVIALIMLVTLAVLTATSLRFVKKHMGTLAWKRVQRLAYPFFALIWLHLLGFLAVPATHGSTAALIDFCIYTAVFLAYVTLRCRQALTDMSRGRVSRGCKT